MKSIKSLLALSAALLFSATIASAASFTFVDWNLQGLYSYKYLDKNQSYNGTWDISDSVGFSTGLNFTDAKADFWFADDSRSDGDEKVSIKIGSTNWLLNEEVDGTINYFTNLVSYDLVTGNLSATLLLDIAADGKLSYKVTAKKGDTYLKETRLTVNASTRNVPDSGSTMALFGFGLLGLAMIARRK